MTGRDGRLFSRAAQVRHTVAEWRRGLSLSLRVRLSLFAALVVATVVVALTYLELGAVERNIEQELVDSARLTAGAIAADLRPRLGLADRADFVDWLHEFIEANPAIQVITIVTSGEDPAILASTSSQERAEAVALARQAIEGGTMEIARGALLTRVASPVSTDGGSAGVVVTVSMAAARHAGAQGRTLAAGFAAITVILLALGLDVLFRRLVHRPIDAIRAAMRRAAEGDLQARAPIARRDELGSVGEGLNAMLARMEHFNDALQQRVREVTAALETRNADLEESYRRVLTLREALAQAERMAALGQMAASVAHQVGTPLNLISGYVRMTREDPTTVPRARERLLVVERQIQQVTRVLRAMLDHARQPAPRDVVELGSIIDRACETARQRMDRSGVRLDLRVEEQLPAIEADATQLELALLNLVTNSLDAMPQGGTLTIRAGATGAGVRIDVADTGPGISPELLPRVFDSWVTTKEAGTGLGLGITRDVVTAHGGAIHARNDPGGGARLTIELPRARVSRGVMHV